MGQFIGQPRVICVVDVVTESLDQFPVMLLVLNQKERAGVFVVLESPAMAPVSMPRE